MASHDKATHGLNVFVSRIEKSDEQFGFQTSPLRFQVDVADLPALSGPGNAKSHAPASRLAVPLLERVWYCKVVTISSTDERTMALHMVSVLAPA